MWEFDDIRAQAIADLGPQPLPAVEQLLLGRRLRCAQWIIDAYARLCTQNDVPSKEDGEKIGWHVYGEVARLRECACDPSMNTRAEVEQVFRQELMLDETYQAGS